MQLVCVPPDRVAEVWPHVSHWIRAASERDDRAAFSEVEADVLRGNALLWLAIDEMQIAACAITEMHVTNRRRVCAIVACGGANMKKWLHLIEGIHDYARAEGCSTVRIMGPLAWAKMLDGYKPTAMVLEKAL